MVLAIDPETLAFRPDVHIHGAWCAVADFGLASGGATLVAIADGTVSLYSSPGGGVLGAGAHEAVWNTATRLLENAGGAIPFMRVADGPPGLPGSGNVRLTVRTFDGTLSEVVSEATLQRGRHVLSPLYAAAQDVLTEVRLSAGAREG